jgi:HNH endonuclease/NUMOD4 motif
VTNQEQWRSIPGFGNYEASSHGRIRRAIPDSRNHACRVLSPWINNKGYEIVTLCQDGGKHKSLVHRLVCSAYHGAAPAPGLDVAHNDGIPLNNCPDNLRWATRSENMQDSRVHGTMAIGPRHGRTVCPERTPRGEAHGHAKLTEPDVMAIRTASSMTGRALASQYGVSPATICLIRSRKIWSHI